MVDEQPAPAVCPFGLQLPAIGTDAAREPHLATVRLADHGVLLAHRPVGASLAGYSATVAQRYTGGAWTSADPSDVVAPCDSGAHEALTAVPPSGPGAGAARGRWLIAACGSRADAPATSTLVNAETDPDTWLDQRCTEDLWLWMVTARSCAEILERFPDAAGGVYAIDPDGPGGTPPGEAFCDQRSLGGGWTQVLGVKDDGVGEPAITRPDSLAAGLAAASRQEGYVGAVKLGSFPSRGAFLELRFYCRRDSGARLHVVTQSAATVGYLLALDGSPPASGRGTYFRVDESMAVDATIYGPLATDASQLGQNDHLWGNDEVSEPRISWTGRWGDIIQGADPEDRLASHPMLIVQSDAGGLPTAVRRGYRATKDARECDGPTSSSPGEWRIFVR